MALVDWWAKVVRGQSVKIRLDRKVVGAVITTLMILVFAEIESRYRYSTEILNVRMLYIPPFFLVVYAVMNWVASAASASQVRMNKIRRLMQEMNPSERLAIRELIDSASTTGEDGEYSSMDDLLQARKRKNG